VVQERLPFQRVMGRGSDARGDTGSEDENDDGRGVGVDGCGQRI